MLTDLDWLKIISKMCIRSFTCFINYVFFISHQLLCMNQYDEEHYKMYPYCGKLFGHDSNNARSRVVNSEDSQIFYPWVVFLVMKYRNDQNKFDHSLCSGTVIGYK